MVVIVADLDGLPELAGLKFHLHKKRPCVVVNLRELWLVAAAARLSDHALDNDLTGTASARVTGSVEARSGVVAWRAG